MRGGSWKFHFIYNVSTYPERIGKKNMSDHNFFFSHVNIMDTLKTRFLDVKCFLYIMFE